MCVLGQCSCKLALWHCPGPSFLSQVFVDTGLLSMPMHVYDMRFPHRGNQCVLAVSLQKLLKWMRSWYPWRHRDGANSSRGSCAMLAPSFCWLWDFVDAVAAWDILRPNGWANHRWWGTRLIGLGKLTLTALVVHTTAVRPLRPCKSVNQVFSSALIKGIMDQWVRWNGGYHMGGAAMLDGTTNCDTSVLNIAWSTCFCGTVSIIIKQTQHFCYGEYSYSYWINQLINPLWFHKYSSSASTCYPCLCWYHLFSNLGPNSGSARSFDTAKIMMP
jgi:hypothetical protein